MPTQQPSRSGIDAKFRRALEHVSMLEQAVAEYLRSEPFAIHVVTEPDGRRSYRAQVRLAVPAEWALLIGDAVHNARSALDHLAWQLVLSSGGTPGRSTEFPILGAETGFGKAMRSKLAGTLPATRDLVRVLQPWRGGDDKLWRLHELDVLDKHRLLVPVAAAVPGITVEFRFPPSFPGVSEEEHDGSSVLVPINAADPSYPLVDGTEVYAEHTAGTDVDSPTKVGIRFDIWLGDDVDLRRRVDVVLRELVEHARDAVEPLVGSIGESAESSRRG